MALQSRYITVETLISMAINTALSIGFVFLSFHGQPRIPVLGLHGVVLDMVPQTFMVLLMSSLVPGLLTRRRIASGRLDWQRAASPDNASAIILRGVMVAFAGTAAAVALSWACLPHLLPMGVGFRSLLVGKALYGMLLAAIATPWAIRHAFRRDESAS